MNILYFTEPEPCAISFKDVLPTKVFGEYPYIANVNAYMKLANGKAISLDEGIIFDDKVINEPVYLYEVEWPNTAEISHSLHIDDLKPGDVFDYYGLYHAYHRAMMCEDNQFIDLTKGELMPIQELKTLQEYVYVLNYGVFIKGDYHEKFYE